MVNIVSFGQLGSSIETAELTDGSVTAAKLATSAFSYPDERFYWSRDATLVTFTSTVVIDATNVMCHYNETSGAQNGELQFNVFARAGTYDLILYHVTANSNGIYTIYVDDDLQGTIDGYSAGTTQNVASTQSITLNDGLNVIKFKCPTKHASSSDYVFRTVGFKLQ